MPAKPPTIAHLTWLEDLKFSATADNVSITLDASNVAGLSPLAALAAALAGCMSADVVHVLTRGRHPLGALRSHLTAERAEDDPHRFLRVTLHFSIGGEVPPEAVDRAIALSREKYCSVWHSMRQDIDLTVTWGRESLPATWGLESGST